MAATPQTQNFPKGAEQKWHCLAADEMREITVRSLQAYSRLLNSVTFFKYLGRIITSSYDDWPTVVGNLCKARKSWTRLLRILGREGANLRVSGIFLKAVVQAVLFFGLETLMMTPPHVPVNGGGFCTGYPYGSLGGILGGYWEGFGCTYHWIW